MHLSGLGLTRFQVVVGRFQDTLPGVLRARAPIDFAFTVVDAITGISADVFSAFLWDGEAQEYLVYWRDAPSALNLNTFDVIPFARGLWLLMDQATTWNQPARDG